MIKIDIPGRETLVITHLVLDYNGTIAVDGLLGADICKRLLQLKEQVQIHILTADTYSALFKRPSIFSDVTPIRFSVPKSFTSAISFSCY